MLDRLYSILYRTQRKLRREYRRHFQERINIVDHTRFMREMGDRTASNCLAQWNEQMQNLWQAKLESWLTEEESAAVTARADEALTHCFDLLGSGLLPAGNPIDWHQDLKTGYRWPEQAHYLDINWATAPKGSDIKIPWELSRCQHFIPMALAYRLTKDARYRDAYKNQVESWLDANPCGYGVNWMCAMDVAIRLVNWLVGASLFSLPENEEDDKFSSKLVKSVWQHAHHIARNLEWQGRQATGTANHFLANLCGLLAAGVVFKESKSGRYWLNFAQRYLEREIRRQVYSDGSNFETSTSYHRLSFEMFLWARNLLNVVGREISSEYRERLVKMADFVTAYHAPSGLAAQFGDNDSGRFLNIGISEGRDHRYLSWQEPGFGGLADRNLLGGLPSMLSKRKQSYEFPKGGYYFAQAGKLWLGIRAGKFFRRGAHAHADQLHFVLSVAGQDVIIDPGTGIYSADPAKRNRYRSAVSHNSPRVNNWEPNQFPEGKAGLFSMSDDTRTEVEQWHKTSEEVVFGAYHSGYQKFKNGCICKRSLILKSDQLILRDQIKALGKGDRIEWRFTIAHGVSVNHSEGEGVMLELGNLKMSLECESELQIRILDGNFSPAYGVEQACKILQMTKHVKEEKEGGITQEMRFKLMPVS